MVAGLGPAIGLAFLAGVAEAASPRSREPPACRGRVAGQDRLDSVGARGELVLASGRRGRLDGLRWPDDPAAAETARAWLAALAGRALATREAPEPDRWGRITLDAATQEAEPVDLAGGLVAAGLAPVDAGESDSLCRPGLLALEDAARRAGRGIWASAPPVPTEEVARLAALAGRFAVVEGRVRNVGERERRTYLNFAPFGAEGVTVTVSKRTWRIMLERGFSGVALRGRRVRARGIVELWRGPTLDVGAAEMIEMLDEEQAQRR
ncbi:MULTISPECIES: thermonuclease family protein [Methylobacterium]|uniref:thermonuclease family protein n=1 Tax=Methylobacterium TaxID=407 RepID=UPI001FEFCAFB|nr:DNA-binding protein [Methylobacterium sp. DB0501]